MTRSQDLWAESQCGQPELGPEEPVSQRCQEVRSGGPRSREMARLPVVDVRPSLQERNRT